MSGTEKCELCGEPMPLGEEMFRFHGYSGDCPKPPLQKDNTVTPERFFASQDSSSHWYVVPVSKRAEWDAWCDIPEDDERSWDAPEFAKRVDGPHMLTFTDPVER